MAVHEVTIRQMRYPSNGWAVVCEETDVEGHRASTSYVGLSRAAALRKADEVLLEDD